MHKHLFHEFSNITHSFQAIFKAPLLLLLSIGFSWLVIEYLPSPMSVFWLVVATLADLITGLLKAWAKKMCSTSIGFRRTIIKIGSYCAIIVVVTIFTNILGVVTTSTKIDLAILINALIGFMTFVELFSVCENISLAYPNSAMTQYFIKPFMKVLKGRFQNNPLNSLHNETKKTNATDVHNFPD